MTIFREMLVRALIAVLVLLTTVPSAWADGIRAESRNFTLISDAPLEPTPILQDLEVFRQAVLADLGLDLSDEREPLTLTIMDDPMTFEAILPGGITAALYLRSAAGHDIVVGYSSQPDHLLSDALEPNWLRLVLRHETVHHILEQRYPRKLPLWLGEGLAEYYATYRETPEGRAQFGRAFPEQERLSGTDRWLPMRTVVESLADYPDYRAADHQSLYRSQRLYYGQSWALAHFVLDQPEGLRAIHRFVDEWPRQGDSEDSFEQVFGLRYPELERQMRARIDSGAASVRSGPTLTPTTTDVQVTRLSPSDLVANRLRLLQRFGRLTEDADARIALLSARAAGPATAERHLSDALRAWRYRDWDAADWAADRVLAEAPTHPRALLIKAKTAYGRVSKDQTNESLWTAAERTVRRALAVSPDDAQLHLFRVAVSLPQDGRLPPQARESLDWLTSRDIRLRRPHDALMMIPALIYEGRFDRADAVIASADRWTDDPADRFVMERLRTNVMTERAIAGSD